MDFPFNEKRLFGVTKSADPFVCYCRINIEVTKNLALKSFAPVPSALESFKNWRNSYRDALFATEVDDIIGKDVDKGSIPKAPETSPRSQISPSPKKLKRLLSYEDPKHTVASETRKCMSRSATEVPKALALPSRSSSAPDVIEVVELVLENTPAHTLPLPKLSPVPCYHPLVVPTPCVSEPDSPLAKDADDTTGFSGLPGDNVVDGSEPSLPLSRIVEGLIPSTSPILSTPSSSQGLVELSVSPKDDTPTQGAASDLSTIHSCRRLASFVARSTSELDPTGIALPLLENVAIVRRALLEATPTLSITPLECNDDPSGLSAKEKCQEFLKISEGGFTVIISDALLETKAQVLLNALCENPTVPNINCTLVVKHTFLSSSWILDLEVVTRNCDQLQTLATSEQRSRTFLTDVDKQKRLADHLFKSYEAMVNIESLAGQRCI
ncbi:hypothetical protein NL676_026157 [Syzygium grande]|nr:hypothetical protein NL676_026157 [Syzygium grande]